MRYSNLFGKTIKSTPTDLTADSHCLLHKAGFIRSVSTGRYAFLPLGQIVRGKIQAIIETEMQSAGSQKMVAPILQPIEFWTATDRDKAFGDEMLVVDDHHGATFVIGATAEGMMVEIVKKFNPSYRDLPIRVHQYTSKFRDEKRPRGGLLRVREFLMKDAYSFDTHEEAALESYWQFYHAYERIFTSLNLDAVAVQADSGAIGGDFNHEFIVECVAGESTAFKCNHCKYRAHEDLAKSKLADKNSDEQVVKLEPIDQPEWVKTMADNEKHYGQPAWRFLKNVVYKDDQNRIIIAVLRGDLNTNPAKIKKLLGCASLTPADERDLESINTKPGYVHSWGHADVVYVGDESLTTVKNFIGGQKEDTTDVKNVNYERDFTVDHFGDIANAIDGAACPECSDGKLNIFRGIEVGHTFKQDHFYTKPMQGEFTDTDGVLKTLWMGAYGIGLGRLMATIVETHHDNKGIVWPQSIAPYQIHLINLGDDSEVIDQAQQLYKDWTKQKIQVLWDDRDYVTAGEKFADADLIGTPWRVVISAKTIKAGKIEIKSRGSDDAEMIDASQIGDYL